MLPLKRSISFELLLRNIKQISESIIVVVSIMVHCLILIFGDQAAPSVIVNVSGLGPQKLLQVDHIFIPISLFWFSNGLHQLSRGSVLQVLWRLAHEKLLVTLWRIVFSHYSFEIDVLVIVFKFVVNICPELLVVYENSVLYLAVRLHKGL